jgi:hypothetical protein
MLARLLIQTAILLMLATGLSAQIISRKAYVITNEFDTLPGFVDLKSYRSNSEACFFRESRFSQQKVFAPGDISGYRILNDRYFVSMSIPTISGSRVLFLDFLLDGILDLYYYRDSFGDNYCIEDANGRIFTLSDPEKGKEGSDENNSGGTGDNFKSILKILMNDMPGIDSRLQDAVLSHWYLTNLLRDYHSFKVFGERAVEYAAEPKPFSFRIAPYSTFIFENYKVSDQADLSGFEFNKAYYPVFGLSAELSSPLKSGRLALLLNLEGGKRYFYGNYYYDDPFGNYTLYADAHLHHFILEGEALLRYNLKGAVIDPTIFAGVAYNSIIEEDSRIEFDELNDGQVSSQTVPYSMITKRWPGLVGGVGLMYDYRSYFSIYCNIQVKVLYDNTEESKMNSVGMTLGIMF